MGDHEIAIGRLPLAAQRLAATLRVEQRRIDAARDHANAVVAAAQQLSAEFA